MGSSFTVPSQAAIKIGQEGSIWMQRPIVAWQPDPVNKKYAKIGPCKIIGSHLLCLGEIR